MKDLKTNKVLKKALYSSSFFALGLFSIQFFLLENKGFFPMVNRFDFIFLISPPPPIPIRPKNLSLSPLKKVVNNH